MDSPDFARDRKLIIELAARKRVPAMLFSDGSAREGALIGYSASRRELYRMSARFVDRILKGAKPADLPVEQPTKFVLGINLKTAKELGLTIPPTLLAYADEVIEWGCPLPVSVRANRSTSPRRLNYRARRQFGNVIFL